MSAVRPSFAVPREEKEAEAATSGSCTKSKNHPALCKQSVSSSLSTARPQPPNPQAGFGKHLAGVMGQQQDRVHRLPLPGKQICWHSWREGSLVGSPRGSLRPLIAIHMPSPAPDSFLPGQDYQVWQTSHRQGQERASRILPSADPCLQLWWGAGWDCPGGTGGVGVGLSEPPGCVGQQSSG